MNEEQFKDLLEQHHIILSEKQEQQFRRYFELLQIWNEKLNLTTIIQKPDVYEKHFYDCLTLGFVNDFDGKTLCDVGAGAGFPSIPLKIAFPNLKVTALDSMNKRMDFVKLVIEELGLENIEVVVARAEDYGRKNREKFDFVTARAVSRLNVLMELSSPLVKVGGKFIAMKGPLAKEEAEECDNACKELKLDLIEKQKVILPMSFGKRYNLIYKKLDYTPEKYPRDYNKMKKKPL